VLLLALAGPVVSAAADLLPAQIEAGCAGRRVRAVRFAGAIRLNRVLDELAWVRAEAGACWHRFEPAEPRAPRAGMGASGGGGLLASVRAG
jgi:hypothetical protein